LLKTSQRLARDKVVPILSMYRRKLCTESKLCSVIGPCTFKQNRIAEGLLLGVYCMLETSTIIFRAKLHGLGVWKIMFGSICSLWWCFCKYKAHQDPFVAPSGIFVNTSPAMGNKENLPSYLPYKRGRGGGGEGGSGLISHLALLLSHSQPLSQSLVPKPTGN